MENSSAHNASRRWDECRDVVIVGSGIAGLAAAIEAARSGARVCVFEKMKITGGNSRISDGALSAQEHGLLLCHHWCSGRALRHTPEEA
ncbi:MAG TPA: FAD-dependent oxidoreductase [Desulfopila sp.]|nr:FAD-dependent oxidoreductase [Desulfopila sp.]